MGSAGFDTSIYPGDLVMNDLKKNTNLEWCGFYLGPAPSHQNLTWMDKRLRLLDSGWGLAPVYVGQQEVGPGSHQVNHVQGGLDGDQACALATNANIPQNSILYLDIEKGGPLSSAAKDYLAAWAEKVSVGGYIPGVYCSHLTAASALSAVSDLSIWVFKVMTSDIGVVKSSPFNDSDPAVNDAPGASAHQYAQNCRIQTTTGTLLVDLSVSTSSDPSLIP